MERETKCIQAGYEPKNGESRMIPIVQSTTFKYETGELPCLLRRGRRRPSIPYLTYAEPETMLYRLLQYMAGHTICLRLR